MNIRQWMDWFTRTYGRAPSMRERYEAYRSETVTTAGVPTEPSVVGPPVPGWPDPGEPTEPEEPTGPEEPVEPVEPVEPEVPTPGVPDALMPVLEEEFANALAMFISNPGFITGAGGVGGWSTPVADWMRRYSEPIESQWLSEYLRRSATAGTELPEYSAVDFLSQYNPQVGYRMTPPPGRSPGGWQMPITSTRRMR